MRAIYYCSNTQDDMFNHNTRFNFHSYIDVNHLEYITNDNVIVAVNSVSFDNSVQPIEINSNVTKPDLIVIQKVTSEGFKRKYDLVQTSMFAKSIPVIDEGIGYVFGNEDRVFYDNDDKKQYNYITYTNSHLKSTSVAIKTKGGIMHNFFLRDLSIHSKRELISYLNNIVKNIFTMRSDKDMFILNSNESVIIKPKRQTIYISKRIGEMLELENHVYLHKYATLRNLVSDGGLDMVKTEFKKNHASEYINTLLDSEHFFQYFRLRNIKIKTKVKLLKQGVFGIRSNICSPSIRNSDYDRILSVFDAERLNKDVVHVQFKNLNFVSTTKEQLSRAHFELIDLKTNKAPNSTSGSPTYIQCVILENNSRMKRPFSIFIDSSDAISKNVHPKNRSMEFTVELPERMDFRKDWYITLKTLSLPKKFFNVYSKSCFFSYSQRGYKKSNLMMKIESGYYPTLSSIANIIQLKFDEEDIPLYIYEENNKVVLKNNSLDAFLWFSPHMCKILGFEQDSFQFGGGPVKYKSDKETQINLLTPRNLIICCDIVDHTIFGGQHVKLLRLVTNSLNNISEMLSFDFHQNEYVKLRVKEFKSISIRIADATGETAQTASSIPTRLQISFVNV